MSDESTIICQGYLKDQSRRCYHRDSEGINFYPQEGLAHYLSSFFRCSSLGSFLSLRSGINSSAYLCLGTRLLRGLHSCEHYGTRTLWCSRICSYGTCWSRAVDHHRLWNVHRLVGLPKEDPRFALTPCWTCPTSLWLLARYQWTNLSMPDKHFTSKAAKWLELPGILEPCWSCWNNFCLSYSSC